jgi:beta-lactam-binding protein with PASTA domain
VVKTKPGKGTYAYQRTITLVVSSGPTKKHRK